MQVRYSITNTVLLILLGFVSCIGQDKKEYYKSSSKEEVITDSLYMFFIPDNTRYNISSLGHSRDKISGKRTRRYIYTIRLQLGIDLCFTNNNYPEEVYKEIVSFSALEDQDIKDYWYLHSNFTETDYVRLCEDKLHTFTRDFFLVIPDSTTQTAQVLHLLNCNYSEN